MAKIEDQYFNFSLGENDEAQPDSLYPNEVFTARNTFLNPQGGSASKRPGTELVYQFPAGISRLLKHADQNGEMMLIAYGTTVAKIDGTVIKSDFANTNFDTMLYLDKTYLVNGDKYYVFDGTTFTEVTADAGADLAAIKRCTKLAQRTEKFYATGDPQNKNYVYFSEGVLKPNNFSADPPTTNALKGISDDGESMIGLHDFHEGVVAFKPSSVFYTAGLDPSSDMMFRKLNVPEGANHDRAICRADNNLCYAGKHGVNALFGVEEKYVSSFCVSKRKRKTFAKMINREKQRMVWFKDHLFLAYSDTGTENNKVLCGHTAMKYQDEVNELQYPWTTITGWNVTDWLVFKDELYFGTPDGKLVKLNETIYKDIDQAIDFYLECINNDIREKIKNKFILYVVAAFKQYQEQKSTVDVTIKADYNTLEYDGVVIDESLVWNKNNWNEAYWGWVDLVTKSFDVMSEAMRVKVTYQNNVIDEPITIYGHGFIYRPLRHSMNTMGVPEAKHT